MNALDAHIAHLLKQRKEEGLFRSLSECAGMIDFSSNDYLGFASLSSIHQSSENIPCGGSTGSRLISGNTRVHDETEVYLSQFYHADNCLLFNTGYMANIGLISSLPGRNDTILFDALCHASIRDGIRLSLAKSYAFAHNNLHDLEKKIRKATGRIFIVTESVFSMDGDEAPIKDLVALASRYHAHILLDEAHAVGVFGSHGEGLGAKLAQEGKIYARMVTFGKAFGCHGAAVLGSNELILYLQNFARSFIYTTAMPASQVYTIRQAHEYLQKNLHIQKALHENIRQFVSLAKPISTAFIPSVSPIQAFLFPGNGNVKKLASFLQEKNMHVKAILSPTVSKGKERLRISLHAFNTVEQIKELLRFLKEYHGK